MGCLLTYALLFLPLNTCIMLMFINSLSGPEIAIQLGSRLTEAGPGVGGIVSLVPQLENLDILGSGWRAVVAWSFIGGIFWLLSSALASFSNFVIYIALNIADN